MFGEKTNERPGTRAVLRHARVAPNKVREVLDLVRDKPVHEAEDILRFSERDAAFLVGKVLHSAIANAENNDAQDPEELFVSACFADEGTTIKRWRPRARGRATRIRKRTSHITVIVGRMPQDRIERLQARRRAEQLAQRSRRVAGARRSDDDTRSRAERRHGPAEEPVTDETASDEAATDETATEESGIVDVEASAIAEVDAGEVIETAADTGLADEVAATPAGRAAAAGDEAGIVDTTAAAVGATETTDEGVADEGAADEGAADEGAADQDKDEK
jgi:large subunit ribosomal protein L22